MMTKGRSFAARILLALVLMICFYALAIGLALGIMSIPIIEVIFADRIHQEMAFFCLILGGLILWSILPRQDRFVVPGPRITERDQPEIFAQIRSIADATGQSMPVDVYVVPEMNAWVANRGGVMGIGSRRVMGLGVPLMQVLSTQEFRSVLAHEFGHYDSGDTKLIPWIYVTRSAVARIADDLSSNFFLAKPFEWYLKLFLLLTQRVSRHQEFMADALSAQTVGPQAISNALRSIYAKATAFEFYWQEEYLPILQSGFRAPLAEGFQAFFGAPKLKTAIDENLQKALTSSESSIFESHPPLKDRLEAIANLDGPSLQDRDTPFIHCVRGLEELEVQLIEFLFETSRQNPPDPIEWEDVVEKVWLPKWEESLEILGTSFEGLSISRAIEIMESRADVERILNASALQQAPSRESELATARSVVATAILLTLHRNGWTIHAPVGQDVSVVQGSVSIEPFRWMSDLDEKKCTIEDLVGRCQEYGIADLAFSQIHSAN